MELRTRADQRELDISRVTLRETGRELQKSGNDLRAGHIDRSIDINIRRQAAGGARRTADGRGTIYGKQLSGRCLCAPYAAPGFEKALGFAAGNKAARNHRKGICECEQERVRDDNRCSGTGKKPCTENRKYTGTGTGKQP